MTDLVIQGIVRTVMSQMPLGRITTWRSVAEYMMSLVAYAGDGDHLEIGVLHGGTAIMAALVKEKLGLQGHVYALDPFEGYYPPSPLQPDGVYSDTDELITKEVDPATNIPITVETFRKNMQYFGIQHRIRIVKAFSYPWPEELEDHEFISAYIDGDHYKDGPMTDWGNVARRIKVGGLVWFDDCNHHCPGVLRACEHAKAQPGWQFVNHAYDQTFVMQRVDTISITQLVS